MLPSSNTRALTTDQDRHKFDTSIQRIANVLRVDAQKLADQFFDIEPMARHTALARKVNSFQAWQTCVQKIMSSQGHVRLRHPLDELRTVLIRYGALNGCTTSGVEQLFSKVCKHVGPERDHMSIINDVAEARIISDYPSRDRTAVCQGAREQWAQLFGAPRLSASNRLDTGVPRKKRQD